jgi:hypothetical protein
MTKLKKQAWNNKAKNLKLFTTGFFMSEFFNNILIINISTNVALDVENSQTDLQLITIASNLLNVENDLSTEQFEAERHKNIFETMSMSENISHIIFLLRHTDFQYCM